MWRRDADGYGATVRRRQVLVDVLLAGAAFALSASVLAAADPVDADLRSPDVVAYLLLAAYSGSVALRRLMPVIAVFAGLLAGLAYAAADYPAALTPVALVSIYTAAVVLPQRRARWVLAGAVPLSVLGTTLGPGATNPGVPALVVSAWLLGSYVGSRRAYAAELEEQNRLLALARLELADRAVAEERRRIARELHDVVAHTMTVVALHAGTGRMVADEDPGAARDALGTIEAATRSALLEMRRLLEVLREPGGEQPGSLAPAPGLLDLDALVADVVRSGVTVEVRVDGERPPVPAGVDLSAYRIVQEALTNVIKHAGRARTTVTVRYEDDAVTVQVDDDGAATAARVPPATRVGGPIAQGHGVIGMRERVAMYDGQFEAGPRDGGGFHVRARLPFRDGAP
jgi:signal transduction histidine kinase